MKIHVSFFPFSDVVLANVSWFHTINSDSLGDAFEKISKTASSGQIFWEKTSVTTSSVFSLAETTITPRKLHFRWISRFENLFSKQGESHGVTLPCWHQVELTWVAFWVHIVSSLNQHFSVGTCKSSGNFSLVVISIEFVLIEFSLNGRERDLKAHYALSITYALN